MRVVLALSPAQGTGPDIEDPCCRWADEVTLLSVFHVPVTDSLRYLEIVKGGDTVLALQWDECVRLPDPLARGVIIHFRPGTWEDELNAVAAGLDASDDPSGADGPRMTSDMRNRPLISGVTQLSDRNPHDLQGISGRKYRFDHPTEAQLAPGQSFPGVFAMVSLNGDQLCGVKLVAFADDLPHVPRAAHSVAFHKHGATHYLLHEIANKKDAAALVADLIKLYDPMGNHTSGQWE